MPVTRKDMVVIAGRLRQVRSLQSVADWQKGVAFVAIALYELNSNFQIMRFMDAVGAEEGDKAQIIAMYRLMGGAA